MVWVMQTWNGVKGVSRRSVLVCLLVYLLHWYPIVNFVIFFVPTIVPRERVPSLDSPAQRIPPVHSPSHMKSVLFDDMIGRRILLDILMKYIVDVDRKCTRCL